MVRRDKRKTQICRLTIFSQPNVAGYWLSTNNAWPPNIQIILRVVMFVIIYSWRFCNSDIRVILTILSIIAVRGIILVLARHRYWHYGRLCTRLHINSRPVIISTYFRVLLNFNTWVSYIPKGWSLLIQFENIYVVHILILTSVPV